MNLAKMLKWWFVDQFMLYGGGGGGGKGGGGKGGGGVVGDVITAAVVVTSIVAPEVAPAVGTLITTGDTAAAGAVLDGTVAAADVGTAATVAGNAAIGATSSALGAAATGQDVGKAALAGGGAAVAGGLVGNEVGSATSDLGPTASDLAKSIAGGATSGFTRAELAGSNLAQATRGAELGGATGALTSLAAGATDATPGERSALGSAIGTGLNYSNVFGTQPTSASQVGGAPVGGPTSTLTTGQGAAPGSAGSTILGSALGVSADPSAPVQTTEGGGATRNVWNQASLRNIDQSGGTGSNV